MRASKTHKVASIALAFLLWAGQVLAADLMDTKAEELMRPGQTARPAQRREAAHQLTGIVTGGGKAMAIIDGGYYAEGAEIAPGVRIKSIEPDRVTLSLRDGTVATLTLDASGVIK